MESGIGIVTALLEPPPPPPERLTGDEVVDVRAMVPPPLDIRELILALVVGPTYPTAGDIACAAWNLDTADWVRFPKYPKATPGGIER